jgi:sn-glycerol 3-phosphate transport system substrate-binding protein
MTRTPTTENSKGLRLGNMPEIRNIIQEELEKAFQGQQSAAGARQRGAAGAWSCANFERANRS